MSDRGGGPTDIGLGTASPLTGLSVPGVPFSDATTGAADARTSGSDVVASTAALVVLAVEAVKVPNGDKWDGGIASCLVAGIAPGASVGTIAATGVCASWPVAGPPVDCHTSRATPTLPMIAAARYQNCPPATLMNGLSGGDAAMLRSARRVLSRLLTLQLDQRGHSWCAGRTPTR